MTINNDQTVPGAPPLPPPTGLPYTGVPAPELGVTATGGFDEQPTQPFEAEHRNATLPFTTDAQATAVLPPAFGEAFPPVPQPSAQAAPLPNVQPSAAWAEPVSKKKRSSGKLVAAGLGFTLLAGAAGIGGAYYGATLAAPTTPGTPSITTTTTLTGDPANANATTQTAAIALPSVVTIYVNNANGQGGSGSGAIISEDGYIITNTHVITLDGASANSTVLVTTTDGRIYEAEVVGLDPLYDLAVIKIDATGLDPIAFADSNSLAVGQTTVALGAPLGLENSVTTGIISALHRSITIASSAVEDSAGQDAPDPDAPEGGERFQFDIPGSSAPSSQSQSISIAVIQTDAAINPGNSGGPLVDANGDLIGINVAIAGAGDSEVAGSIGLGFSIPSNVAKRIADEIIANGSATHGLLGATVMDSQYQGASQMGAYIRDVTAGGAAEAAGLQPGDIVVSFNGVPIRGASDLTAQVRAVAAYSTATIEVLRNGAVQTFDAVQLGELAG